MTDRDRRREGVREKEVLMILEVKAPPVLLKLET